MSYILDALRRADAERRRGQVPVLHDPAVWGGPNGDRITQGTRQPVWKWTIVAILLLAAVALGVLLTQRVQGGSAPAIPGTHAPPSTSRPEPAFRAQALPVEPTSAPHAGAGQPPSPSTTATPDGHDRDGAAALSPLPPSPVVRLPAPPPTPDVASSAAPGTAPKVLAAARTPASVPSSAPASAAAGPTARPSPPIPASALPEPQRSAVARLALGGAVYSPDRLQRFVLLAGQIVREGATLAPGIVLERIEPRALLLRVGEQAVLLAL
jgi:general secretion pathway protein B